MQIETDSCLVSCDANVGWNLVGQVPLFKINMIEYLLCTPLSDKWIEREREGALCIMTPKPKDRL